MTFFSCKKNLEPEILPFRNVVVIVGDDHSYEVARCYDNEVIRTPNLDKLAREGILFENAYSNSPICSASRQSLLTGKYPHATGVNLLFSPFNDRMNTTIAEHLRDRGFQTCVIGKTHFNNWIWYPLYEDGLPDHGFKTIIEGRDYQEYLKNNKPVEIPENTLIWDRKSAQTIAYKKNAEMLPQPCFDEDCEGTYYARQAVEYMKQNKNNPFFLWVAFHEPHAPFNFPIEYKGKYDPYLVPLPEGSPEDDRWLPLLFKDLSVEEKRGIIASYYTSVEYLDKNIGIVLDGLKAQGLEENTLIIYLSDQGYLLNDHKRFEKHTMWEESIKAPLIVKGGEKLLRNIKTDALVEFVDVVPTITDLLGIDPVPSAQGKSFLPVLKEPGKEHKSFVFAEFLEDNKAMIASKDWKYIFTSGKKDLDMGHQTGYPAPGIYHRLYDLAHDPEETTNLAYDPENKQLVDDFQQKMLNVFLETSPYVDEVPEGFTDTGKLVWFCEPRDVGAQPGGFPYRIFEKLED
jgi:arylsulfatase A-like enzyme